MILYAHEKTNEAPEKGAFVFVVGPKNAML